MKDQMLGKIKKSAVQQVRVQLRSYRRKVYVDIRSFFRKGPDDDWAPSKKGVTFRPEQTAELIAALEKLNHRN